MSRSPLRPSQMQHFVQVGGTRIRYVEAGSASPGVPLVMLAGYNGSAEHWFPYTLPGLAEATQCIAPDLPGNGWSGAWSEYTLEAYADFVPALLDALGVERADLMGHSMGGQIAIASAVKHPERFRRLVLVDSAGLGWTEPLWLVPLKMLTDRCMRQVSLYPTYLKVGIRSRAAREQIRIVFNQSVRNLLGSVAMPTLVVWGEHDRIIPVEHGKYMVREIPSAQLEIVRAAGHMPFFEKPVAFNSLVADFLGYTKSTQREDVA